MIAAQLVRPSGTGPHLSTGGLEFDETLVRLGRDCALRMAASVDFPREYPARGSGLRLTSSWRISSLTPRRLWVGR